MKAERIDHVFWDWNGTLLDDAWLCRGVMNDMLVARNMPEMSEDHYMNIFEFPVRNYYLRIGFDFEQESFEQLGAEFIRDYEVRRHEPALHEDAIHALRQTRDSGRSQSILSAYKHDTLEELVEFHGLRSWFNGLHGHHDMYAAGKVPQARQALHDLDVTPDHAVLIGDTVHDAEVAAEIGIHCILIPGGNHTRERLETCGCPIAESRQKALELLPLVP